MKKKLFSLLSLVLAAMMSFSFTACNPSGGDDDVDDGGDDLKVLKVLYMAGGSAFNTSLETTKDYFNKNVAGDFGFRITLSGTSQDQFVAQMGNGAADVFILTDTCAQAAIDSGFTEDLNLWLDSDYFDDEEIPYEVTSDDIFPGVRERHSVTIEQAGGLKDYYGDDNGQYLLTMGVSPLILFYNVKLFEQAGIKIVSFPEEDLGKADTEGLGHYGYHVYDTKPACLASDANFVETTYYEFDLSGNKVQKTGYRVFNNRISMSTEEVYGISSVFSISANPSASFMATGPKADHGTKRGMAMEAWFPYLWSLDEDCVQYDSVEEQLVFGLPETYKNYLVVGDGVTIGEQSFVKGDILNHDARRYLNDHPDKLAELGVTTTDDNTKKLYELPSAFDSMSQFVAMSTETSFKVRANDDNSLMGAKICAATHSLSGESAGSYGEYFAKGFSAMFQGTLTGMSDLGTSANTNFKCDVAPLPQYKEYDANGNVKTVNGVEVKGYKVAMSNDFSLCMSSQSHKKKEATVFISWFLSEAGQTKWTENGCRYYLSPNMSVFNKASYRTLYEERFGGALGISNYAVFYEMAEVATVGDWGYTADLNHWVSEWAGTFNSNVRTSNTSMYNYFYDEGGDNLTLVQRLNQVQFGSSSSANNYCSMVHHYVVKNGVKVK